MADANPTPMRFSIPIRFGELDWTTQNHLDRLAATEPAGVRSAASATAVALGIADATPTPLRLNERLQFLQLPRRVA